MMKKLSVLCLASLCTVVFAETKTTEKKADANPPPPKFQAPLLKNLGTHQHHAIATNSTYAQQFFNQGLILFYGFEWGEAIRSFREATRLDPECAMCYWGLALALGAKANAPMNGHEYQDAKAAIEKAVVLAKHGPVSETDYTKALTLRFQHQPKPTAPMIFSCHTTGAQLDESSHKELLDYAAAMQKLTQQYPNDNDAKALYAFALANSIDWKFWDIHGNMNPTTATIIQTLNTVLTTNKRHVGANHYSIHVMEESPQPEIAAANADRLRDLVPGSEHLVHMPTHIYFLTGRFHEATDANQKAIAAYKNYSKICRSQGFEPEITYLYHHDFDFLRTTAAYEGRKQLALSAANELIANLPSSWLEQNMDLQTFLPVPLYVKARFGLWEELLKELMPKAKYVYAVGMWHYARGVAYARTSVLDKANDEANELKKIVDKGPADNALGKPGNQLLTIAYEVLSSILADAKGDEKSTLAHLETARKIQYDMGYHEPPDWYFPIKEGLGDAYLKWNHPQEAVNMYEQVLRQYPRSPWALFGLAKALRQLNQAEKAKTIDTQFRKVWQFADVKEPVNLISAVTTQPSAVKEFADKKTNEKSHEKHS